MLFFIRNLYNFLNHIPPLFNEGEIWWCTIGENIGAEISGKGDFFRRPVVIIRKLDKFSFIGVPITSQSKIGTWYEKIEVKDRDNYVILPQVRYVDYRRMDRILCTVDSFILDLIRTGVVNIIEGK